MIFDIITEVVMSLTLFDELFITIHFLPNIIMSYIHDSKHFASFQIFIEDKSNWVFSTTSGSVPLIHDEVVVWNDVSSKHF